MDRLYTCGDVEIDLARWQLRRAGEPVHVEPRVLDLIVHLLRQRDRVVPRTELLDTIWGDRFVSESALSSCLKAARRVLGDSGAEQRIIRTVQRRGYQFIAEVQVEGTPGQSPEVGSAAQRIQFCESADGARIAWAAVGSGPPLMKAANWMTHLDLEWTSPVWGHWLRGLATGRTLVRYDERGCGMSARDVDCSFDNWLVDLETVVAAAGLTRFPLLGVSQGGAVAISYAVAHPQQVSHLVLAGAYARGRLRRAMTDDERVAAHLDLDLARVGWSSEDPSYLQVFASQFLPSGTDSQRAEFLGFFRRTTCAGNAVRFLEVFADIDVTALAPQLRCPTLIVHSRGDLRVPVAQAVELASAIPNSKLVLLDSANHLLTADEPAWPRFLAEVAEFLDG